MSLGMPRPRPPLDDLETPYRSTKDRRRWCGGKVGVPHQPALQKDKYGGLRDLPCEWRLWYVRGREPKPHYACSHQLACSVCGKILEYRVLPKDCPAYRDPPAPVRHCKCFCGHTLGRHEVGPLWRSACDATDCGCRRFAWVGFK